jgi:hypothetical protein
MPSATANESVRIKTCKWIDKARQKFVHSRFIITSRYAGYLGKSRLGEGVLELSIQHFTPDEVREFLIKWFELVEVALHPEDDEVKRKKKGRDAALEFLAMTPRNTWWSLQALVDEIKEMHPDFQRPAGDYDSWHIADASTGEYLRGFDNWGRVDGALIRFIITGPLHWLGIVDLAAPEINQPVSAFRTSAWSDELLKGAPAEGLPVEDESLLVSSDARLRLPRLVPRAVRYQVARFTRWERAEEETYSYHITHNSLRRAGEQGIQVSHILTLLRRHALTVPPNLVKALERWEKFGSEAHMERALILRLRNPEMLQSLRSSRAARFLGDPLSATVIVVKPGAWEKVVAILAELGYIVEGEVVDDDHALGP